MKKLLVTAIGAAAALGAFAAGEISLLRFEDMERGAITISDLDTAQGTYWSADQDATNNTYEIVERAESIVARQETAISQAPTNALSVKTTFGKPLSVNVVDGGAATNINEGLYFDSLVKFTVCEDTPEQDYSGAKIVMWLQEEYENDEIKCTNLMVRAGYLTVDGNLQVSNAVYNCGEIAGDFADKFHRVTIKAIGNITTSSTKVPGFAIYIDGSDDAQIGGLPKGTSEAKWDSTFTAVYTLTEAAADLASSTKGALFPSLDQSSPARDTLTAASFDGTGSLSDIIFTANAPEFAEDYVSIKATVDDGLGTAGSIVPFKSLAAAVDYVNGKTTGTYTMMLSKGMPIDGTLAFASSANVILDFAGLVITNDGTTAAISNNGKLTITNSTVAVGGVYCSGEGAALVSGPQAYYTDVRDGCFWGAVSEQGLGALLLYGGSYAANTMTGSLAPGKVFSVQSATYPGLYDVIDAPTTYTVRFFDDVEGSGQMIGEAQSVESGALAVAPAAPTKTGYTFVDWTPSTNVEISANTDFYPTWTANNYSITYYDGESALELAPATYTFGTGATLPASAGTKAGYDFAGWYDNAQFTGDAVTAVAANETGNKAFYAKYTATTYTITFVAEGGTVDPASTNYTIESGAITLPSAVHNGGVGLQFDGWTNTTMTITTADLTFTPTAANLGDFTLYAKWTAGGPTYPNYINTSDATIKKQYDDWAEAYTVAPGANNYEAEFLLNVAPGTTGAKIEATAVSISGTTVTIDINRGDLNGYPYVKKAATVAGLASPDVEAITIVPADQVQGLDNGGRITLTGSGDAQFYQIGVQVAPVAVPNTNN